MKADGSHLNRHIILGSVQFGLAYGINNTSGQTPLDEVKKILSVAGAAGIEVIDTADAYGNSQETLAQAGGEFKILSKFVLSEEGELISGHLDKTLKRLSKKSLECYSFHRFKDIFKCNESEIARIKEEGRVRKFGVSIYSNEEFDHSISLPWVDVIQIPFNLLDNWNHRGSLLRKAKDSGKTIHTRSTFLQGLFFKSPSSLTGNLISFEPYLLEIERIAKSFNVSIEELALAYVLSKKEIDGVILGVDSCVQLQRNIDAVERVSKMNLSFNEVEKINVAEASLLSPSNWRL